MSKFEGTDFDNVSQSINANAIKAAYNAWKEKWSDGDNWGIVGGTAKDPKPKTVLEQVMQHGDATYARDGARSIDGLGDLIASIEEILDGDVIETEHVEALDIAIEGMFAILKNPKWNPRNIPFETVVEFAETDDPKKPKVEKKTVYGHYRTKAYNEYTAWAQENKKGFKGKMATSEEEWYDEKKGKAQPPLWQAITGEGSTQTGKGGILAIARDAKEAVEKIEIEDDTQIGIYNNSAGPKQLAQIKSVQEKVLEVLQNRSIYAGGEKTKHPQKDRLNAAFSEESYAIRNKEEAALLNFAKGYDRIANIDKIKSVKLRFPLNNKALNATIRNVFEVLGQDIKQYQTPKMDEGASAGLTLKGEPKTWSDILKVDEEKLSYRENQKLWEGWRNSQSVNPMSRNVDGKNYKMNPEQQQYYLQQKEEIKQYNPNANSQALHRIALRRTLVKYPNLQEV